MEKRDFKKELNKKKDELYHLADEAQTESDIDVDLVCVLDYKEDQSTAVISGKKSMAYLMANFLNHKQEYIPSFIKALDMVMNKEKDENI